MIRGSGPDTERPPYGACPEVAVMPFVLRPTPAGPALPPHSPLFPGVGGRPRTRVDMTGDPLVPGAHPYGRRADDLPDQQRALDRRVAAVVERMSDAFLA